MAKVLDIDDDTFRVSLVTTLEKRGFQVLRAAAGGKGIQLARDHAPA